MWVESKHKAGNVHNVLLRSVHTTVLAEDKQYLSFIAYCECVFVACIILTSVACPTLQYFITLSHKRRDFREKSLNMKCVFRFSLQRFSETFLILRRTERDIVQLIDIIAVVDRHCFFLQDCGVYCAGRFTLVTLPLIVTPYRDSVDETRARVTYQKLVTR